MEWSTQAKRTLPIERMQRCMLSLEGGVYGGREVLTVLQFSSTPVVALGFTLSLVDVAVEAGSGGVVDGIKVGRTINESSSPSAWAVVAASVVAEGTRVGKTMSSVLMMVSSPKALVKRERDSNPNPNRVPVAVEVPLRWACLAPSVRECREHLMGARGPGSSARTHTSWTSLINIIYLKIAVFFSKFKTVKNIKIRYRLAP